VAIADVATILGNTAVTIPVLENDVDLDNELTVAAVGTPDRGTVVNNNDGTLTYTPPDQFTGKVEFSYTVSDGEYTADAVVTIFALSELSLIINPRMDPVNVTQLREGATAHLRALGDTTSQGTLELTNLMQWISSNTNVVEPGSHPGTIVAKAPGTATITAKVGDVDQIVVQGKIAVIPKRPVTPKEFAITQLTGEGIETPTIQVSWTINDGLTYNLYSKPEDGVVKVIPGAKPPFLDKGLTVGKVYQYWVSAVNDGGESIPTKQLGLRVKAPEVLPPPPPPPVAGVDLEITSVQIDKTAGDIRHGEAIEVTFVIKNNGAEKYSSPWNTQFKVDITMDPDPQPREMRVQDYYQDTNQFPIFIDNLASGQSLEKTVTYYVTKRDGFQRGVGLGEYYLRVIADSSNLERESDESNNEYVVPVKFNLIADDNEDLVVSAMSASSGGTPIDTGVGGITALTVGDPIHLNYTIANTGSSDTWGHYIGFYLVPAADIAGLSAGDVMNYLHDAPHNGYQWLEGVPGQGEITGSFDTFVPYYLNARAGTYKLLIFIDRWSDYEAERQSVNYGIQKETDEYNNVRMLDAPLTISATTNLAGPNLVLTQFDMVGGKTSLQNGEQFAVEYTIENQGDMPTRTLNPIGADIYVNATFPQDSLLQNFFFIGQTFFELNPGEKVTSRVSAVSPGFLSQWKAYPEDATLTLTGVVDPINTDLDPPVDHQVESNENDNSKEIVLQIRADNQVDLVLDSVVLPQGNTVTSGEEFGIQYTVSNIGSTPVWNNSVGFTIGDYYSYRYLPSIPSGESISGFTKMLAPPGLDATATLVAKVDPYTINNDTIDGIYDEVDELNNSQEITLNVQAPLLSTDVVLAPGPKDGILVAGVPSVATMTITNTSGLPSQGGVARAVFQDCTVTCKSVFFDPVRIESFTGAGTIVKDIPFEIPYDVGSTGPYYLYVRLLDLNFHRVFTDQKLTIAQIDRDLDMTVVADSVQYTQSAPETIDISATVQNVSQYTASPHDTPLVFCLTTDAAAVNCDQGVILSREHIPSLTPGTTHAFNQRRFSMPALAGTYYLLVYLDNRAWHDFTVLQNVDINSANNSQLLAADPLELIGAN